MAAVGGSPIAVSTANNGIALLHQLQMRYNTLVDQTVPFTPIRWAATIFLACLFMLRVVWLQGWYIIAYALGIYLLNLFLLFLQPKYDMSTPSNSASNDAEEDDDEIKLPTSRQEEEFRPFIRKLPEFKFWYWSTRAIVYAMACTFFEMFNLPVFWPILLMYFIILFALTMRRQIQHMIKFKYVPFDIGKKKYSGK